MSDDNVWFINVRESLDSRARKRIHQAPVRTALTVLTVPTVPTYASAPCSSYRLSFRYSVEGSIPSTSAARVLLPPSAWSTHMM